MPTVADFVADLERFAPSQTAAEWDNVGLLLGNTSDAVERVMTCLTITPEVVEEAVAERVNMIISHHPVLFRGAKKLSSATPEGRLLLPLLRAGVAVYSPHTAFDNCVGGINDILCRRLGILNVAPLRPREGSRECKLAIFVPECDLAKVSDALFSAGAGVIGKYNQCSFRLAGTGTFFGTDETNPTIGQKGRREYADEWRLEVVVPEAKVADAVRAMRKAHSYEEPAFDVYQLKPNHSGGEGRVGELPAAIPLRELASRAKSVFNAAGLQMVGDAAKPVTRIGVACGAAGEYLLDCARGKVDVFVTGEVRFHDALSASSLGVSLILPGHYATERPGSEELAEKLASDWPAVKVWASRRECDPLAIV